MPRFLIITAWYYPFIHPRAHRWTALAEYWAVQGIEVHVVCAKRRDYPSTGLLNGVHVHRTGFDSLKELVYYCFGNTNGRGRVGAGVRKPGIWSRLSGWWYNSLWKNIYFPDDACLWYFPARRKIRKLLKKQSFDALISVSLPFTGHLLGLAVKKQFPSLPWLADIGDPFTIQARPLNNSLFYGRLSRRLEHRVLRIADAVVVTNPGAAQAYELEFGPLYRQISVISPLLHPYASNGIVHLISTSNLPTLRIGYFGAFYAPVRTPDAFLDILKKTFARHPDWPGRLEVHFFGEVFPEFWNRLRDQPAIRLYGLRSREEVWSAIRQMDFLLHIGNSTEYQLPSKAVEYLASGKPVVHLSYVKNDPFVAFWGDNPGLIRLNVEKNAVGEDAFQRWIAFLEGGWRDIPERKQSNLTDRFGVPAVAEQYAALLGRSKPS